MHFGTGYSSLSYLTRFSIDTLEARPLIRENIMAGSADAIVVSAVIDMGRSLKHIVIAEGVETAEQLAFLQLHGCHEGQGYYFGRPVTAQQFAHLLETPAQHLYGNHGVIPFHREAKLHYR